MNRDCKITVKNDPVPYLFFENVFDQDALNKIWQEFDYYKDNFEHFFRHPRETGGAGHTEIPNSMLKRNKGFFFHDIWHNPNHSALSRISQEIFYKESVSQSESYYFRDFMPNEISILCSVYGPEDYYLPHKDATIATGCLWLYKEPKKWTGGKFRFVDYDVEFECNNNTMVVFPGPMQHEVTEIEMDDNDFADGYGRYTISYFMNVRNPS